MVLTADAGSVDILCKALVDVPVEVELLLVDELFGVSKGRGVLI